MKLVENIEKVYYIKKVYKYDLYGRHYKNTESRSTFVRVQTNSGSRLYRTNRYDAMLFESIEVAKKYQKENEQICELKLGKNVLLERDSKNRDVLVIVK